MNRSSTVTEVPPKTASQMYSSIRRWQTRRRAWQVISFGIVGLFCAVVWIGIVNRARPEQPLVTSVDPPVAAPGSVVTVLGRDLGRSRVAEVYLSEGTSQWSVEIVAQSTNSIRFRIPRQVEPGYARLVFQTSDRPAKRLDQAATVLVRAGG